MPYLRRLSSGRWLAEYRDAPGRSGRKHSRTFPAGAKQQARAWAAEQERLVRVGKHRDPRAVRQTVGEYEPLWAASRIVEATTERSDRQRLDKHVLPEWGSWPLDTITPTAVQGWVKRLVARDGLAPATARSCHQLLASLLKAAVRDGLISDNPARDIALPTLPAGREVYLTRDEVDQVGELMSDTSDRTVLMTLAYTGMRWGEVAGLHMGRLDLLRGRLDVVEVLTEIGGTRTVKPYPKGKRQRTVPLPPSLVELLAAHLAACPAERDQLVFRPRPLCALSRNTWGRDRFKPAVAAALQRRDVRVHDLRHSYASWLVQAGVPMVEVQRILGHQSIVTTQRYAHLAPDQFDAVLGALGTHSARPATMLDTV